MKTNSTNALVQLIQTLDDGVELYLIAQAKTESPQLRKVFHLMAEAREFAIMYIRPYANKQYSDAKRTPIEHNTYHNQYTDLVDDLVSDESLAIVRYLEEQAIDAMVQASIDTPNTLAQFILRNLVKHLRSNFEAVAPAVNIAA